MPKGGRQPGAGRPKGSKNKDTLEKELVRERVRLKVSEYVDPLVEAQVAQALGIKYLVTRDAKTGKFTRVSGRGLSRRNQDREVIEVWEKDPSTQAFTDLMNRAIDKPKEQAQEVEVTGNWDVLAARLASARPKPKTT